MNTSKMRIGKAEVHGLKRAVGLPGAILMGLGSILGTGIFISIGVAAGVAGPAVILAIPLAALVAILSGLSSAQLAASHPVSGGTYEYGYRYLNPALGFTAGWMFLCAKSASAATAALGFAGYVLVALNVPAHPSRMAIAIGATLLLTVLVASGISRSSRANALIVSVTLASLLSFVAFGLPSAVAGAQTTAGGFFAGTHENVSNSAFLEAIALMFVAYTGYGRIATLGEEVREPRKTIPQAIIVTLGLTAVIYAAVGFVAVATGGAARLSLATTRAAAPLEIVARDFNLPLISKFVAVGAITAMLGVLLNLVLGLSRVVLAMARRGDMPARLARVDRDRGSPTAAVLTVGAVISGLAAGFNVKTTWSFSAFTVLIYYALTNLAALRLPMEARLYPRWISLLGLASCLSLAFWVEVRVWATGLALLFVGFLWHGIARIHGRRSRPSA